jgi:hypothetical protein
VDTAREYSYGYRAGRHMWRGVGNRSEERLISIGGFEASTEGV